MTIQQLQYVLEIAKTGSVTQTARNLFLSQPNISNAVKNLESELGIIIFSRTPGGMVLTPEGQRLVSRAGSIIQQLNDLIKDVKGQPDCYFRMNSSRYIPGFEAFADLCKKYQDQPHLHFSCFSDQDMDPIHATLEWQYDLHVFVLPPNFNLTQRCKNNKLNFEILMRAPMYVQLRQNHPLTLPGAFSLEALRRYPFVDYTISHSERPFSLSALSFVNPDRLIRVQSITSRRDIVQSTNAFSVVLPHSQEYNQRHGLINIPLPDLIMDIGYIYPSDRPLSIFAREYIELFCRRLHLIQNKKQI